MNRFFLLFIYFIFSINLLCEAGCNPSCDPIDDIFSAQIEECQHTSCELSHTDQHNYVKDDGSDSAKKFKGLSLRQCLEFEFEIVYLEDYHQDSSVLHLSMFREFYFYPNRKRYQVFHRLKLFS